MPKEKREINEEEFDAIAVAIDGENVDEVEAWNQYLLRCKEHRASPYTYDDVERVAWEELQEALMDLQEVALDRITGESVE